MKVNITKKIGKSTLTFQIDGEKDVDTLLKVSAFTTIPDVCTLCKSDEVELTANKADAFTFIKVKCLKCGGTANMGQYKDGSGSFWKAFEKYEPKEKDESY